MIPPVPFLFLKIALGIQGFLYFHYKLWNYLFWFSEKYHWWLDRYCIESVALIYNLFISTLFLKFFHVTAYICSFFSSVTIYTSTVWKYYNLFTHSPVGRHLVTEVLIVFPRTSLYMNSGTHVQGFLWGHILHGRWLGHGTRKWSLFPSQSWFFQNIYLAWSISLGILIQFWASLVAQPVKNLPAMWETWVHFLG